MRRKGKEERDVATAVLIFIQLKLFDWSIMRA